MALCLIGLGSNLGDRVGNLLAALAELRKHPAIALGPVSSFHETRPVGGPVGQANYFNAAAIVESELGPRQLLDVLLNVEKSLGRERTQRWGPRTIDLDLLLHGETVLESPELNLPHSRMAERRFVLAPATEVAADWRHPKTRKTIGQMLAALPDQENRNEGLRVVTSPTDIRTTTVSLRREGQRVALVPTMGALHDGHLSLVRAARERVEVVIATIFVNPTQFGPQEDLNKYPRTLDADLTALSAAGCNLVFVPTADDIYPPGFSTYVDPPAVARPLEGVCRPGHFRGVASVVLKLFHLIPADVACFGQKDFQQLLVIRHVVRDLAVPIEIIACPTVREVDGLALSSRNRYLSPAQRQQATALSRALNTAAQMADSGERDGKRIEAEMRRLLTEAGIAKIDYAAIANPDTLAVKPLLDGPAVALIAAFVGQTRLIDNRLLTPDP